MSVLYTPSKIDHQDADEYMRALSHFSKLIRGLKTVSEEQQAQWIHGTMRALGYTRAQMHRHPRDSSYDVEVLHRVHQRFMEDFFSINFYSPDSIYHKRAVDYTCPDEWLPHIRAGTLREFLFPPEKPKTGIAEVAAKNMTKSLNHTLSPRDEDEDSLSVDARLSFYQIVICVQTVIILGLCVGLGVMKNM